MSTSIEPASRRLIGTRAEGLALLLLTACSWGLTWPQAKFLLTEMPPFTMRSVTTVGGAGFAFTVAALRREDLLPPRAQWGRLTVFAMLNFGGFMVFATVALAWLNASEAIIVTYTLPIWAGMLAWPILGERPNLRRIAAMALGLVGVALLVGVGSVEASWSKLPGVSCGLLAAAIFGLGTVVSKRRPLALPPVTSVAWQATIGAVPLLILALWEHPQWTAVTPVGWLCCCYIMVLPMTVAYLAWFRALRFVSASTAATMVLVSPLVGVFGSALLLGDPLGPRQLVAMAVTLTGVGLAARG
ncbi:MAG TPA: EamA family transporter [Acetobacteraceae bacterium]|nr:EamA family transporter [Acetobacteraceae bacterium]